MKNNKYLKPALYLGWVLFFLTLWLKCDRNNVNEKISVNVPDVKGVFYDTIIKHDTIVLERVKIKPVI